MSGWMDIETAPNDGTGVLVTDNIAPGLPSGFSDKCGSTNTYVAAWWPKEGWVCYMDAIHDPACPIDPTHWMPLPPPPVKP